MPQVSGEGEDVYLADTIKAPFEELDIIGHSEQESTTGKQLLDWNTDTYTNNGITTTKLSDGGFKINGTATDTLAYLGFGISTNWEAGTYKFSLKNTISANLRVLFYDENGQGAGSGTIDAGNTTTDAKTFDRKITSIRILIFTTASQAYNFNLYLMVNEGTAAEPWEKYTGGQASPNPQYKSDIKNCGDNGNVNVKVQNKNLAEIRTDLQPYGGTVTATIIRNDTTGKRRTSLIKIKPSTNYVLSKEKGTSNFRYFYFDKEPVINETVSIGGAYLGNETVVPISTPENAEYLFVQWTSDNDTSPCGNVQIEEGETVTDYIAHAEQTISFPLAQGQKLMEGDYLEDDGVHHVRKQTKITEDNIDIVLSYGVYYDVPAVNIKKEDLGWETTWGSDALVLVNNYKQGKTVSDIKSGIFGVGYDISFLRIFDDRFTSLEVARTLLIGTIIEVPLAEEQIDPYTEEQQAVYDQIKEAYSYKGGTHISSPDEVKPRFEVSALRDLNVLFNN